MLYDLGLVTFESILKLSVIKSGRKKLNLQEIQSSI
jgi:RecA/RadA recombinase